MQFGTFPVSYRHVVCCLWYGQSGTLASFNAIPASFARVSGVAVRFQSSEASTAGLTAEEDSRWRDGLKGLFQIRRSRGLPVPQFLLDMAESMEGAVCVPA